MNSSTHKSRQPTRSRVETAGSGRSDPRSPSASEWLAAGILSVLLTALFWAPLWGGAGLIGGDLYPYYLPQKVLLADSLKEGLIPLWNPLVGFGYPILGESQTGALYPPHLLYGWLTVNTAYNAIQLGHYIVTFLAAFGLARRLGLATAGGLLAATAFTYGWFPPRICLEWAIIGGMWFTLILWSATIWIQTGRLRCLPALSLMIGLSLLAGHYNILFIALLLLLPWPWLVRDAAQSWPDTRIRITGLWSAALCGFLIGAVQLVPTWELKQQSQRQQVNDAFAPTYGHLPPRALSQLWLPWAWYAGERSMDEQLQQARTLAVPTATNQAEAQLYVGLAPLLLAVLGWIAPPLRRELRLSRKWGWLLITLTSLLFATGWPTYWLSGLPGIGYFRGPGRYSLVAVFTLALMAGAALDALIRLRGWGLRQARIVYLLLLGITAVDLWAASRQYRFGQSPFFGREVFYAIMVDDPPINHLEESPLRKLFASLGGNMRLYAPGQNMPTLLGVSAIPVYLGLGPELYESEALRVDTQEQDPVVIDEAVSRLRHFGVTHLLLEAPLSTELWPVTSLGQVIDPLLNRCFARREPFYLYELSDSPGRASFVAAHPGNEVHDVRVEPNRVVVQVRCATADRLILRDLAYPGWRVSGPGAMSQPEEIFRAVELEPTSTEDMLTVEWIYRPASVLWGLVLSGCGLLGAALLPAFMRRLQRPKTPSVEPQNSSRS